MTNSRLTDPEVLETRYPVLVEAFSIRRGSGGQGGHRGGDGLRLLAQRRPDGLDPAQAGRLDAQAAQQCRDLLLGDGLMPQAGGPAAGCYACGLALNRSG